MENGFSGHSKNLRFTVDDLRKILSRISVRYVAEFDLKTADEKEDGLKVKGHMKKWDFDVMPIKSNDRIVGYVLQSELTKGTCESQKHVIEPSDIVAESTAILDLLLIMRDRLDDKPWLFVLDRNEIRGIVTIGDFRKAPVRMFLFALVNLLEMHFTHLIRRNCKEEELEELISQKRLKKAKDLLEQRKKKNEALDIFECLQFCDKRCILQKKPEIFNQLMINSKNETLKILKKAEALRDRLAHGNDMVDGITWRDLINLTGNMEKIIEKCEQINTLPTNG